jgi:hypothetical protein
MLCSVALLTVTPADEHRLEPRHRRQRTGATDLELHVAQHGHLLLRRVLVRDRPARSARHEAQALLQSKRSTL